MSDEVRQRPRRARAPRDGRGGSMTAAEIGELARDRLIESRLTPNAISLAGLLGNLVAAVLILEHHFVLAGIASYRHASWISAWISSVSSPSCARS